MHAKHDWLILVVLVVALLVHRRLDGIEGIKSWVLWMLYWGLFLLALDICYLGWADTLKAFYAP